MWSACGKSLLTRPPCAARSFHMSSKETGSAQILAVLLGAGWYPRSPKLAQGASFDNSARDMREYLTRSACGLGLPRENINWLYDDSRSAADQLGEIRDFLDKRQKELKAAGTPATDLIVYYLGHGLFYGRDNAYCLAIRATEESESRLGLTSVRVSDLAQALNESTRFLRRFLILDACFAGAAYSEFQSGPLQASLTQIRSEMPSRGTALLCASNAKDPALAPRGLARTMFSDALLKSLETGHASLGTQMSLSEVGALVRQNLQESFPDNWVRPEIHCPDQREGEVADVGLFPNPARGPQPAAVTIPPSPKHEALQLAQKRRVAEDAARQAQERSRAAPPKRQQEQRRHERPARLDAQQTQRAASGPAAAATRQGLSDWWQRRPRWLIGAAAATLLAGAYLASHVSGGGGPSPMPSSPYTPPKPSSSPGPRPAVPDSSGGPRIAPSAKPDIVQEDTASSNSADADHFGEGTGADENAKGRIKPSEPLKSIKK